VTLKKNASIPLAVILLEDLIIPSYIPAT